MLNYIEKQRPEVRANSVWCLIVVSLFLGLVLTAQTKAQVVTPSSELHIRFAQPATNWETDTLPIGNGALGANVYGLINHDVVQFAEKTLWTGGPNSQQGYDFGLPPEDENYADKIKTIQTQIDAQGSLSPEAVAKVLGRDYRGYGSYQNFASVKIDSFHDEARIKNYQRSLDLDTAIATVSYSENGVNYVREYFVSYPDQVIVCRMRADQPGKISLQLSLQVPENRSVKWQVNNQQITLSGELHDNALQYATILQVHAQNGRVKSVDNALRITEADELWFTVAAATNYQLRYPDYRGEDALPRVKQQNAAIAQYDYANLLDRHLQDYQTLFSRVSFELDQQASALTTPELLTGYKSTNTAAQDRALEVLYFQYGRYLLISSSRAGSLPANLQGVWNQYENAPWSADYHVNINLQMNYWLADVTNLPETLPPLFAFIDSLTEPGKQTAARLFNSPGWTLLLNTNIWGFTGLIAWPTAFWQPEAGAWMAQHYYEHYRFSQDHNFLSQRAYPIMLGASEFWLANLHTKGQNIALVSPSYSPEHGNFTAGAAMSQQIVYDLLNNTREAANILGDSKNQQRLDQALATLEPGLRIGSWGQLQEWREDLDDKESNHRHVSHLFALHPGNQLSPLLTPQLAEAAKTTLNSRGDGGTGWSKAWKINFWARLHDAERAHKLIGEQLLHSTLSNLWDNHPPFQIDGNFGATAGIAEMLLQSHLAELHLLPALPFAWANGHIRGLKARGNISVDLQWKNGRLNEATFKSMQDQLIQIRCADCSSLSTLSAADGKQVAMQPRAGGFSFVATSGVQYRLLTNLNTTRD